MKRAADIFLIAVFVWLVTSCGKTPVAKSAWAAERSAEKVGVHAVFRLGATTLTPGERLDGELEVCTSTAIHLESPELHARGLETLEFTALPTSFDDAGNVLWRFQWILQAGAPNNLIESQVRIDFKSGTSADALLIALPDIVIRSVIAPGEPADKLPPLEETDAL